MITRYEDKILATIWSRKRQLQLWASVEAVWMKQLSPIGYADVLGVPAPPVDEVDEREHAVHHEFVAFLDVWSERFRSDEAARWVHYGLTSSDVIDTATALQLVQTNSYLDTLAREVLNELAVVRANVGDVMQVGRTHGQWAQPRKAKTPLSVLYWMLHRQHNRVQRAAYDLGEADLSGATGGRELVDPAKVEAALGELGLRRALCSSQILPRDGWVHWAHTVAGLVTCCEAIAEHYWLLAQSEVGEVEVVNGAGSSTMPHKRGNPHLAENVRGLARLARMQAHALAESVVQRGDRDLAHSSVERVCLPDLAHLAATALKRTAAIISDYRYAPERIESNMFAALHERIDSAIVQAELVRAGSSRRDAIENTRKENPHE